MKKIFILLFSFLSLVFSTPANSVEFGQDATGDPNAVYIQGNTSGFLYSERIVITAAHVLDQFDLNRPLENQAFVYLPGISNTINAKQIPIVSAIIPKTYLKSTSTVQFKDDIAILILKEDVPVTVKVKIASQDQMERFANNKSIVQMIGYGMQNGQDRINPKNDMRAPNKLLGYLYTPQMMTNHYNTYQVKPPFWNNIEYGVIENQTTGTICSGDSGSGFFVEEDSIRYYVGTAGNGLGHSNCKIDKTVQYANGGAIDWFSPAYKFLDLINSAENIVAEQKEKELQKLKYDRTAAELKAKQEADAKAAEELKAKQEADAKAAEELKAKQELEAKAAAELKAKQEADAKALILKKITITCFKGNSFKKVTAIKPICPKGYKIK
jgi:hypothetical protein